MHFTSTCVARMSLHVAATTMWPDLHGALHVAATTMLAFPKDYGPNKRVQTLRIGIV